ncbi:zinc finger lsd1 subclass family protein (macronuclear) [Tetrahymena thermophila SB210]|uniref:Zinc finger lsd1 subclass family protein n=1 Tax=Tetrahymena thermophila (strain SB210) TaxID=312017 RepID=Q22RJ4_TETTS|nr:zinc finger lsd1 subclass family protein [Tetrahymena thermophila SB210]EAR88128.2 zinc finger lsd1 subclass family protein [Tetrahymena thermophila SB210]|eukprot:XP_001008373.2 zinc finger lsd1 subclass family protein [Tetrahymena thermophila SB210]
MLFYSKQLIILKVEFLVSQDFTDPTQSSATGWSQNTIATCNTQSDFIDWAGNQNLNGILQENSQQKTYSSLPPHWSLSLRFDLLLYGDVDQTKGDQIQIFIDGNLQDTYTKNNKGDGIVICYKIVFFIQCVDELILYHKNITHSSSSVIIQILPQSPSGKLNKGFGFKNYYLYVDTCDYSCATCNGPTSNQCLTCPANSLKSGSSCTCVSGYIQHKYVCVTSCPAGFTKSQTENKCISDFSINCLTYNSSTQLCSQCKPGYYIYQGQCVNVCPQTSSLNSGTCVDFSTTLINGQYLLNGLFNQYFGQSEITGLGLSVSNFKGFMSSFGQSGALTTNCGSNHLLGGFWLSGSGSSISRSWTGLIGFTVWKIDQWNNENFFVSVDGQNKKTIQFSVGSGNNNICGFGTNNNDQNLQQIVNITHTSSSFNLKFYTDLVSDVKTESFGISNLYVLVDFCSSNCLICSAQGCLTCQASYFLYKSACVQTCPTNTYLSNSTTCTDCNSNCKTCSNSATFCTSCNSPNYLIQLNGSCVSSCPQAQWPRVSDGTCQQCDQSCYTCTSPGNQTSCTSCSGTNYLYNKQCISICPSGTYANTATNNNQCLPCNSNCSTCNGPNSNNCTSCPLSFYLQSSTSTCVSSCNSNQYADNSLSKCINCNLTCTTCSGSSNNCQSCSGFLFLSTSGNTCTINCLSSEFKNTANNKCEPCHPSCNTCSGSSSSNCLSCQGSLYFNSVTKTCQSTCPDGTYPNSNGNVCSQCDTTCLTCNGGTSSNCLSCTFPSRYFQPLTSQCVTQCNTNQYAKSTSPPTCQNCDPTCKTCSGTAPNNCLSCSGNFYLSTSGNICTTQCQNHEFQNSANNKCTTCDSSCFTCSGSQPNNCLSCQSPSFFQPSSKTCVLQCNTNQYSLISPTPVCLDCDPSCATCSGPTQTNCLSCHGSNFLDSTTKSCVTTCPNGTYLNASINQCTPCDPTCTTCNGPSNTQCMSCTLPKYYQQTSGQCVITCNINQYQDSSSATCINCNSSCASCSGGGQNNCLSCSGSLFLDLNTNTCVSNCPLSYYQNSLNNQCSKCNSSCSTCNGGQINNCLSCNLPLLFDLASNTCTSSCSNGQYMDLLLGTCQACDQTCTTCTNGGVQGCSSCALPLYYEVSSSSCVQSCQSNQYQDNSTATCSSCDSSCASCSGPSKNECLSCSGSLYFDGNTKQCVSTCPDSYFADLSSNTCKQCDPSCKTCNGSLSTNCESCTLPLYYNSINKKCVANCDQNQYKDSTTVQCLDCDSSCQSCSGPQNTQCLSCSQSLYLDQNMCKSNCQDGYYQNTQNNTCSKCDASCSTCSGSSPTNCLKCALPRYFQQATNTCEENCQQNQFLDNTDATCEPCHFSCSSCSGPTNNQCQSCSGSMFLYQNQCASTCPDGYFQDIQNNKCSLCNSSCKTCNSVNFCLSCQPPLINYKNYCIQTCPSGFYTDTSTNQCQPCYSSCQSCSGPSANECLECSSGTYFKEQACVDKCGDGYFINQDKCSKCHPSCKNCQGDNIDQCTECQNLLIKYNSKCLSDCPQGTYLMQNTQKQCLSCNNSCLSNCSGPSESDCTSLRPKKQIIVYILFAKTLIWIISSIIGIIQDQKNKKAQNLTVVPSNLIEKQLNFERNDSPVRKKLKKVPYDGQNQLEALKDSDTDKIKQQGMNEKEQLPTFNQNERFPVQFDNQFDLQAESNHVNAKSEVNQQNQEEYSPKGYNRRRPRKTQFILKANIIKSSQLSMNALSSQVNIIESSPITSKRQLQDQSEVASTVAPYNQFANKADKLPISKYQPNQKLKYSIVNFFNKF